jgi:hypothetical protein
MIPALGRRQQQEDHEFEDSLGYRARQPYLKKNKKEEKKDRRGRKEGREGRRQKERKEGRKGRKERI